MKRALATYLTGARQARGLPYIILGLRLGRRIWTMSNDDIELEPGDYHLAVRRREHAETPWRWEIWAAGRTKAVEQSTQHYATMSAATKEGKAALRALLRERFSTAA